MASIPQYGAIDLGGTKLRAIVARLDGQVLGENIVPTEADGGPEHVIARMIETLEGATKEAGLKVPELFGLGVASPGALDLVHGRVYEAPQLPGWDGVQLAQLLSDKLGIRVLLENDANAAALGENRYGAGVGTVHMVYLTISTGVGGGIIIDGRVYHGATGSAGELGHVIVQPDGTKCLCGEHGHLEGYSSGTGIAWRAEELVSSGKAPGLARVKQEKGELDADEVADAARAGDGDALKLFEESGYYLGIAMADFVNIFNPQAIVLGGGVTAGAGDLFIDRAEMTMREQARKEPLRHVRIHRAALGDRSGPLGMIALLGDRQADIELAG
jgi:glucokinase